MRLIRRRYDEGSVPSTQGPARVKLWIHIVWWLGITLCLAVGTLLALWVAYGKPSLNAVGANGVTPQILFDAVKIALASVAGVGGVVALVVAYRRQRLHEAEDQRQHESAQRDQTRLFNERFVKATEHLGADKAALRLAGVYALASLADDWDDERQTCIEVLCAYLRMPYRWVEQPPPFPSPLGEEIEPWRQWVKEIAAGTFSYQYNAHEERQVRLAIMRTIRDHLNSKAQKPWFGYSFDFSGAMFEGAEFDGAEFVECDVDFSNCLFYGHVSFSQCKFIGSHIRFTGAIFAGRLSFELAQMKESEIWLMGEFADGLLSFYSFEMFSGRIDITADLKRGGSISFIAAELGGGEINVYRLELGGESSLAFSRARLSGTSIRIVGKECRGGTIYFNGLKLESGVVHLTGDETFYESEPFDLSGVEVSMDSMDIDGGQLHIAHVHLNGSHWHVDDLAFSDGAMLFADVRFSDGSLKFSEPAMTGGRIKFQNVKFEGAHVDLSAIPNANITMIPSIDPANIPIGLSFSRN